jgi:hypothetical protein
MLGGFVNPLASPVQSKELPVIFDDDGFVHGTWEYCLMGEREGWLERTGMHTGNRNIVYHHFVMIHAP